LSQEAERAYAPSEEMTCINLSICAPIVLSDLVD
jgi:hypothetical protein